MFHYNTKQVPTEPEAALHYIYAASGWLELSERVSAVKRSIDVQHIATSGCAKRLNDISPHFIDAKFVVVALH